MQQQTQDVLQLVRNSEAEAEKVRLEKMNLMQKWTTAVINIAKRDEALEGFRYDPIQNLYNLLANDSVLLSGMPSKSRS